MFSLTAVLAALLVLGFAQQVNACQGVVSLSFSSTDETTSANDGTIDVLASGGAAPYTYAWGGVVQNQTTASLSDLAAGSYNVTVTDNNGCSTAGSATVQACQPSIPTTSLAAWSCGNVLASLNSYIYCNAVSGATRYEYRFYDPLTGFVSSGFSHAFYPKATFFASVWVPGIQLNTTYQVQVRAKKGNCWGAFGPVCELTTPIVIPETQLTTASCGSTLNTVNDYFFIDPVAGAMRYEYEISDGNGFSTTMQSLNAYPTADWFSLYYVNGIECNTTYNVRVRVQMMGFWGAWGPSCTVTTPTNDVSLSGLALAAPSIADASCAGGDGAIQLNITGGNAPFQYVWSSNAASVTGDNASGLHTDVYAVTVTDNLGCFVTDSMLVAQLPAPQLTSASTNESCSAGNDGAATVTATGGAAPYTYQWGASAGNQTTAVATGLGHGTYTVAVTDANTCLVLDTVMVAQDVLDSLNTSFSYESCMPGNDGTATVGPTDGMAPYTYQWDAAAGNQTTATATGLVAGSYAVSVIDAGGCTATTQVGVAVAPGVGLLLSSNEAVCEWGDGSATASPIGGTPPFTWAWDANTGNQTTETATGLDEGTYDVTITDGNTCETFATVNVGTTCVEAFTSDIADGGWDHSLIVCANGQVWASGDNAHGQLGDGNSGANLNSAVPVPVQGLDQVRAVSVGQEHSVAVRDDGSVWTWGLNDVNQLGNSSLTQTAVPVMVPGISGIIDVAAGDYHTIALANDGTVWGWGNNSSGQVGTGNKAPVPAPVQVTGLSNVVAISAGGGHSMALLSDGSIRTWGNNGAGQLGINSFQSQSSPTAVPGIDKVKAIAAGGLHSLAVRGNGDVWSWGSNSSGQLGDSTYNMRLVPIKVTIANVVSVAAGNSNSRALKADGSVWSWGYTYAGSGGTFPVIESNLTSVTEIGAGDQFVMAVTNTGNVVAFGYNGNGPLGIGNTTTNYPTLNVSDIGCSLLPDCGTMTVDAMESTNEVCFGRGDGTTTAFGGGGVAPYSYEWDAAAGNQTTQKALGLVPGTYSVTVTDFQGCTAVDSVSLGVGVVVPTTSLEAASCGAVLASLNSYIYCQAVPGATRYRYEFSDGNGFVAEASSLAQYPSATFFSPYYVPGLQAGIAYNVRVKAQLNGCWGDYGAACTITAPSTIADVQVASAWCGATLSTFNQYFYISGTGAAQRYQYEVTGANGFSSTGFSPSSHPTATWFSMYFVPGVQAGQTYQVRVRAKVGGVWGTYGPACDITIPASANKTANSSISGAPTEELVANLYPNPTNGTAHLLLASHEEAATVRLVDMSGRVVEQHNTSGYAVTVELNAHQQLPAGIYVVQVQSGAQLQQLRLVVR